MPRPNLFIVGASKAGTTSLAQALREHPSVFMTQPKEPNFFNCHEDLEKIEPSEIEKYLRLYDSAEYESILGEASVSYFSSVRAAQHIVQFNPQSKILISLRNPLERIISLYEMYVRHGLNQTFEFATNTDPWLVRQCLYAENVKRYVEAFPKENILCVNFDDLNNDWAGTLTTIQDFLLITRIATERPIVRNMGGLPRYRFLRPLMNRNVVQLGKQIIPDRFHATVDGKIKGLVFSKSKVPRRNLDALAEIFSNDIKELDSVLNTEFYQKWFGHFG